MSKKRNRNQEGSPYYWQTDDYNRLCYAVNVDMLLAMAINRFRWVGLPDTCDPRFLERQLHRNGLATIAHPENADNVWLSLMAAPQGTFNVYGLPTKWIAKGYESTEFSVNAGGNGELVFYSQTRLNPWGAIVQFATKLTHIQRTMDVNLLHQQKPIVLVAPQEKKLELTNIYKQISGYEPAILGDKSITEMLSPDNVFAVDTKVPYIGSELSESYQNVLNDYMLFMGIPHQRFEKQERLTKEEAKSGSTVTNILLKNCLDSRRWACERLRKISPETFADTYVYLNDDWESFNYNYSNNIESMAQSNLVSEDNPTINEQAASLVEEGDDNGR